MHQTPSKTMKQFLLVASCLLFSHLKAQWKGFTNFKAYPVKEAVHLFHTKDITGEGVPDVTTLYSADQLKMGLLTGKGKGQLQTEQTLDKEENYYLSDIADLNGDGIPDMVISSYWANGFKIFFGKGGGKFQEGIYVPTGVHGRAVKCVDINQDGKTDIISTTSGSGNTISLHVFLGKGDGSFLPKKSFPSVLDTSKEIFVTDKNGDGLPDVAVSSSFPWLVIFYQTAEGNFIPEYIPTNTTARPAFYDFDKDGKEDLLLLYPSFDNEPGSDSLILKLNTGGKNFSSSIDVPAFRQAKIRPYNIRVADINNDGYADLLMDDTDPEGYFTDTLYYMLGGAGLHFFAPVGIALPAKVLAFELADMNADGKKDLIVSCSDKTLYLSLNSLVEAEESPDEISVYPNPARSFIRIRGLPPLTKAISIYNGSGQLVSRTRRWPSNEFSTTGLSAGIYFLEIVAGDKKIVKSFMIQ